MGDPEQLLFDQPVPVLASVRAANAPRRRLVIRIQPAPNESLLGYLTRVADHNVLQRPADILDGVCDWPPGKLTRFQQDGIAQIIGIPIQTFKAVCERSVFPELPRKMLSYGRRRLAPASLRVSPHHRASWSISAIDFCVETWQVLIENCPSCRAPLGWGQPSVHTCPSCTADLRKADSDYVPDSWRPVLTQAMRLATVERQDLGAEIALHEDLGSLSPVEVFQLAVVCGRALKPPRSGQKLQKDEGWSYLSLAAGMELVMGYPASVHALTEAAALNALKPVFFRRMEVAAEARGGDLRKVMIAMSAMDPKVPGIVRLRNIRQSNNLLSTTELARALRVENASVKAMADAGVFGQRNPRGVVRKCDWFTDRDVALGRECLDGRTFASTWAKEVDLSVADVRQLMASGLLQRCSETVDRAFQGSLQIEIGSLRAFEEALLSKVQFSSEGDDFVPIEWAFASIGGGYKPWAAVITAALADSLPHGLRCPGSRELKLGRLLVHESVAFDIRQRALSRHPVMCHVPAASMGSLRPNILSRTEVERLLNCLPADISRLCKCDLLNVVSQKPTVFEARSVEQFAQNYISIQEISALLCMRTAALNWRLPFKGFERDRSGFWERKSLWGPDGIIAAYRRRLLVSAWENPGPPKPVPFWPGLVPATAARPLELFSREQPDQP